MKVEVFSIETAEVLSLPSVRFITPFSHRVRVTLDTGSECLVEQYHKDDCDIHNILKRFWKTGILPITDAKPVYGDFSNVKTYQEAQTLIARVNEYFESLPSRVRERFSNDPAEFLDFVNNPENRKECEDLGIFEVASGQSEGSGTVGNVTEDISGNSEQQVQVKPVDKTGENNAS